MDATPYFPERAADLETGQDEQASNLVSSRASTLVKDGFGGPDRPAAQSASIPTTPKSCIPGCRPDHPATQTEC